MRGGQDGGFTLVELMITIAIVGILLGAVAPSLLGAVPGLRVSGASRQVLADFRLARTLAIEKGHRTIVEFHAPSTGQYRVFVDVNNNGTYDGSPDVLVKTVPLTTDFSGIEFASNDGTAPSDGVAFGAGNVATFQNNGSAVVAGDVYLRPAKDAGGRTDRNRRVTVAAATGNVSILSYDPARTPQWQ